MQRKERYKLTRERNESDMICEKIIDTKEDRNNARDKAAEMLKHRILNDGIFTIIDKSHVEICPMEWEKIKHE